MAMRPRAALLIALTFVCAEALPTGLNSSQLSTLEWTPCNLTFGGLYDLANQKPPLPYQCANLSVPLDYTDPHSDPLTLNLIRVEALYKPAKASILFNPGGPGGSGIEYVAFNSEDIHKVLGGTFDLIGFDPRGTGKTIPFHCDSASVIPGNLNGSDYIRAPDSLLSYNLTAKVTASFATSQEFATACKDDMAKYGAYLGTAFVARDMLQIVNALGEDHLNYFGTSYGTFLGTTFASMFPDRVGRVLLDSTLNPHDWRTGYALTNLLETDDALFGYLNGCIENPSRCVLAQYAPSGDPLELLSFVNSQQPLLDAANASSLPSWYSLKSTLFGLLYEPTTWSDSATSFNALLMSIKSGGDGNTTTPAPSNDTVPPDSPAKLPQWNEGIHAVYGIACSEWLWRAETAEKMLPIVEQQQATSMFADTWYPDLSWTCAAWQMRAKEIYDGDFTARTANPVMLVNGIHDPITPFANAQNVSAGFPGSRLLQHNGYGHSMYADPSLCTAKAVSAYFNNGTLPAEGTQCDPDVDAFDLEFESTDTLPPSGSNRRTRRRRGSLEGDMAKEEVELLRSMKRLGRKLKDYHCPF